MSDVLILLCEELLALGVRAHLVVVVHEVNLVATTVCGASPPVVAHIIKYIHLTDGTVVAVHSATHRPVTSVTVDEQVMMV